MNFGHELKRRQRGGKDIEYTHRRMRDHQKAATLLAIFSMADGFRCFEKGGDILGAGGDFNGIDRPYQNSCTGAPDQSRQESQWQ